MKVSNRENATDLLETAGANLATLKGESFFAAVALTGIGYSLLDVADAVREGNESKISMADFEAWANRAIAERTTPEPE